MNFLTKLFYRFRLGSKAIRVFFSIIGPGIIVMVADNDAGGITTYSQTGAQTGFSGIWFLVILLPVAYFVQEMTVRQGAVTKRGHAEAIFSAFGPFWGWFSLFDLVLTDWLTLVTEFIGMTAAMSIFGLPPLLTCVIVIVLMGVIMFQGKYWTWEKITLVFCVFNLIYIPAAFFVHPDPLSLLKGFIPNIPQNTTFNALMLLIMANIGTTIAPWMIFFQQSSVVDKGLQEKDIRFSKLDTFVGSVLTVLTAIFIVIVTGATLAGQNVSDAAGAARALGAPHSIVGTFLAIGLFDAGLLGAICISLARSWAFGEIFGWAHTLNRKVKQAPFFYLFILLLLISAAAVVLVSPQNTLITITLMVQVVAVTLLPSALVFLVLLLNDRSIMGDKYRNSVIQNIIVVIIVAAIIVMSSVYAVSAIFPQWFPS